MTKSIITDISLLHPTSRQLSSCQRTSDRGGLPRNDLPLPESWKRFVRHPLRSSVEYKLHYVNLSSNIKKLSLHSTYVKDYDSFNAAKLGAFFSQVFLIFKK